MSNSPADDSDGSRIKRLMAAWIKRTGLSQAAFAKQTQMPGGSSMISQHKSGHRPVALEHARAYMAGFGCALADISPALSASLVSIENLKPADTQARHIGEENPAYVPVTPIRSQPPSLAQSLEVLALHLNYIAPHNKKAAESLLNALVASPAIHANITSGLLQLEDKDSANAAAA